MVTTPGRTAGDLFTCHLRQAGLKDGDPSSAAILVVNTYRLFLVRSGVIRWGSSFRAYVCKGNRLKRRFMGSGVMNHGHRVSDRKLPD